MRRCFGLNSFLRKPRLRFRPFCLQGIDAQIERCQRQQAGGQRIELVAHLGAQRLDQPGRQVVHMLGAQVLRRDRMAGFQPGLFLRAERGAKKIARTVKAQNGQPPFARAAARARQKFIQGLAPQHGVGGFGQRGAFTRAKRAVFAKEAGDHGVGRMVQAQDLAHQFGGGIKQGVGMHWRFSRPVRGWLGAPISRP